MGEGDETFDEIQLEGVPRLEAVSSLSSIGGGSEIEIPTHSSSLECGISTSTSSLSISVHSENNERCKDMRRRALLDDFSKYFNKHMTESKARMGHKTWE